MYAVAFDAAHRRFRAAVYLYLAEARRDDNATTTSAINHVIDTHNARTALAGGSLARTRKLAMNRAYRFYRELR